MNAAIVLVRPKYPRNVGMVSRIMENFGLEKLILIAPRCEMDEEAREGAAQGQAPLRNVKIYSDWSEFLQKEPDGPRLAFSRRSGRRRQSFPLTELKNWSPLTDGTNVSLIFGTEDHGLSTEDLEFAHRISYFEIPGALKSMNLSHAVVFALSQLMDVIADGKPTQPSGTSDKTLGAVALPDQALKAWLTGLDFDLTQERWNAHIALRKLLMKAAPTLKEVTLLESVIQQTLRRLHEAKKP